jgi:hypothetical protein
VLCALVASCARTGFQGPPELDGSSSRFDRPGTEGIVLDVVGQDLRHDAAAQDVAPLDGPASDLAGLDASGSVDGAAPDLGPLDLEQPDPGPADTALVDTSAPDLALEDAAAADAFAPDSSAPDTSGPDTFAPDTAAPDTFAPDTFTPDTFAPDTTAPDTFAPDTAAPDTAACAHDPPWWDPAFALRRPLQVAETATGQLEAGYSVALRYDSRSDVTGGNALASGDDVRVVRYNGLAWVELDRHVRGFNTVTTEIWFKTDNIISASDSSYWLYLSNPAAGAPPAAWADGMAGTSAVYLAADDFEDDTIGQRPDGWVGAGDYTVQSDSGSQVLRVVGSGSNRADYFFAGDYGWTDVALQGRLRIVDTGGTYYGLFARVESTTPFDTLWWGLYDANSLQAYELEIANPQAEALNGGTLKADVNAAPPPGTTWHSYETRVVGRSATFFFDGAQKATNTLPQNSMQAGRVGLCAGYTVSLAYWDDIIVRRLVSPEPTVSVAGLDEPICP